MAPRKKVKSKRKKYCHCSPECSKKLVRRTRRHHYNKIPKNRQHLIRPSESCSDQDSDRALSPLNQGMNIFQDLMDSSGSSGGEDPEGGEALQDESKEESDSDYEDYGMGQVSGNEEDDVGAEDTSNDSEDLDSDNEIRLGGFSDSEDVDSEFDDWKAFDEEEELEAEQSDKDALREFEEMMGDEEYAELWSTRMFSPHHV